MNIIAQGKSIHFMVIDQFQNNSVIEDLPDRLKVTIQGQKRWGWFLLLLFPLVMNGFCFFPLFIFIMNSTAQQYLHSTILVVIVGLLVLVLYINTLNNRFAELIDSVFDKEIIEVNEQQVTVERSGFLGLKKKSRIRAENIKGITLSSALADRFNFLNRFPLGYSKPGTILIWKRRSCFRPFYLYGRGLSQVDAQRVLNAILRKYPQYRFTDVLYENI